MPSWLIFVIFASILIVGAVLLLIGIMGENITRLRNINVELKGEIKHLQERNEQLEKELMKYDKKRRKKATELLEKITDGVISKATLHKTILLDDRKEKKE